MPIQHSSEPIRFVQWIEPDETVGELHILFDQELLQRLEAENIDEALIHAAAQCAASMLAEQNACFWKGRRDICGNDSFYLVRDDQEKTWIHFHVNSGTTTVKRAVCIQERGKFGNRFMEFVVLDI